MHKIVFLITVVMISLFAYYIPFSLTATENILGQEVFHLDWFPCVTSVNSAGVRWANFYSGVTLIVGVVLTLFLLIRTFGGLTQQRGNIRNSFILSALLSTTIEVTLYLLLLSTSFLVGYKFVIITFSIFSILYTVITTGMQLSTFEQRDGIWNVWNSLYNYFMLKEGWDNRIKRLKTNYKTLIS